MKVRDSNNAARHIPYRTTAARICLLRIRTRKGGDMPYFNRTEASMTILSFDGRVNIAVRIVTARYPQAKLYEADGVASAGPTTDPAKKERSQ